MPESSEHSPKLKSVLVTGASGLIGTDLLDSIKSTHEVRTYGRKLIAGFKGIKGELSDRTAIDTAMNNINTVNNVFLSFKINFLNSSTLNIILITASIVYISTLVINKYLTSFIFSEILFFVLFYFLSLSSTLILCFSVYFIFFHSILSIKDQVKYIYGSNDSNSLKRYLLNSMPYFILAIIFLILFYNYTEIDNSDLLPIIFTFLAAITFPHVIVIEKMYRSMK